MNARNFRILWSFEYCIGVGMDGECPRLRGCYFGVCLTWVDDLRFTEARHSGFKVPDMGGPGQEGLEGMGSAGCLWFPG